VLKKEWRQHKPTLDGSENANPIYLDLGQQLADQRVEHETARAISAGGKQQIEELEERLKEIRKIYHPLRLERIRFENEFTKKRMQLEHEFTLKKTRIEREFTLKREDLEGEFTLKKTDLDKKLETLRDAYDTAFQTDWENYKSSQTSIVTLRPVVQHLHREIEDLEIQQQQVQEELKAVQDSISFLLLQRDRLGRNQQIYQETFDRFSKLVEETRIAREKAAGDIQLLTRAVEPRLLPRGTQRQKALIGAAVGFMLSTVFAFLLEYVHKARQLRRNAGAT